MKGDKLIILFLIFIVVIVSLSAYTLYSIFNEEMNEEENVVYKVDEDFDFTELSLDDLDGTERFLGKEKQELRENVLEQNMRTILLYLEEGKLDEAMKESDDLFYEFEVEGELYEENKELHSDLPYILNTEYMFINDPSSAINNVKNLRHEYTLLTGALMLKEEHLPYVIQSDKSLIPASRTSFKSKDLVGGNLHEGEFLEEDNEEEDNLALFRLKSLEEVPLDEDSIPMDIVKEHNENIEKVTKANVLIDGEDIHAYFSKNKGEDFLNLVMFYDEKGGTNLKTQEYWKPIYQKLYKNIGVDPFGDIIDDEKRVNEEEIKEEVKEINQEKGDEMND